MSQKYQEIITFWFEELGENKWFAASDETDALIKDRFAGWHKQVAAGECVGWRENALGTLAEVIVLDQFSRNIFRGQPQAFAYDGQALVLAQVAIDKGFDKQLSSVQRPFLYMPFMHSESVVVHETAVELFSALENKDYLKHECIHKEIIDEFGRYPHRNKQLGRATTNAEQTYLDDNQLSFFGS